MKNFKSCPFFILIIVVLIVSCQKDDEDFNVNDQFIAQLKTAVDSVVRNTSVPGAIALVRDHERDIYWEYASGISNLEDDLPMQKDYTFRIASITKTFTGTVLLQLVDEGLLSLDDKLSDYYPQYPKADSVTIKMLSNMTSVIYDYNEDSTWWKSVEQQPGRIWALGEIVDVAFQHSYLFSPGTQWCYSNTNTFLLGMIIEQVTGNSLQIEIQNRIISFNACLDEVSTEVLFLQIMDILYDGTY